MEIDLSHGLIGPALHTQTAIKSPTSPNNLQLSNVHFSDNFNLTYTLTGLILIFEIIIIELRRAAQREIVQIAALGANDQTKIYGVRSY